MYLKRITKFLPDQWGLKTSPASQSSLNEIVFRSHERSVKSLRSGFFKNWLKLAMRFFTKSERFFHMKVSCQYGFMIEDINESDLYK
jgi:hypothetical protein